MSSLKPSQLVILAATGFFALSACNAQEPSKAGAKAESSVLTKPVAMVNGVAIPQSRMDSALKENMVGGQQDSPELRASIRDMLINQEIIAQEAMKQGTEKSSEYQSKLETVKQQLLINTFLQHYVAAHPVSDEELKKEFEKIKAQMGDKEYKVRHILVKDEAEAKDIIADLKKGGKFAKIAAAKSMDPGSKTHGGELDWAPAGNYVKPFAEAVEQLKKGEFSKTPVHTDFGWHVVLLEDTRPLKTPSFEQVKPNLQQRMQSQTVQKLVAELRAGAKIE